MGGAAEHGEKRVSFDGQRIDIIEREGEVGGAGGETGCRMKAFQWLG